MNRVCWWCVDVLSRTLETDERDAVCGDLTERGATGRQALKDILGLVLRRQLALWTELGPWAALLAFAVPIGTLLSLISVRMADGSAIYIWLYANNWDSALLRNAGFRHDLLHHAVVIFLQYTALACWAWSSGLVLGMLSRRALYLNSVLFCLALLFGELFGVPRYFWHWILPYRARDLHNNAAVFVLTFYRVILPIILQIALLIAPALWGTRQGLRAFTFRPVLRWMLWSLAIATLGTMWWFLDRFWHPDNWGVLLLRLFLYWPVGYLIISIVRTRERATLASARKGEITA